MQDKPLSANALNKLSKMSYEDKVRLFARCYIIRQNPQIAGILTAAVGKYAINDAKAEIVHHLYDQNDQYNNTHNYNELLSAMMAKQNVYDMFDDYTLCAYVLYYQKFIELAEGSKSINGIRRAKEEAFRYVKPMINFRKLNMDFVEKPDQKTEALLRKEYRRALVQYLAKDLNITKGYQFIQSYVKGEHLKEVDFDEADLTPALDPNKVYANQVEVYKSPNTGRVYYMTPDGDPISYDEIEDITFNGITLKATKDGIVEVKKEDEFIR